MRTTLLLSFTLLATALCGQISFKPHLKAPVSAQPIDVSRLDFRLPPAALAPTGAAVHPRPRLNFASRKPIQLPGIPGVSPQRDPDNGRIIALEGRPRKLTSGKPSVQDATNYLATVAPLFGVNDPLVELTVSAFQTDELGQRHARITQRFNGLRVLPADGRLHARHGQGFDGFSGHLQATPRLSSLTPRIAMDEARTRVQSQFAEQWVTLSAKQRDWVSGPQLQLELVIFTPPNGAPTLSWLVDVRPNLLRHTSLYLDANTGQTIHTATHTCGLHQHAREGDKTPTPTKAALLPDGPATATVTDLFDRNVTINTFSLQDTFYLLDGSREMFTTTNGQIDGFILTYDAAGGTPLNENFNPGLRFSLNNRDWDKTSASVHNNAGIAYQYFRDKFGRNSIDGNGGNVLSFMNIGDEGGGELDNAFWNGRALFYGNGNRAFRFLPRALDVAGHEMAHGVIQSTAGLIYEEQSGAMNESFADIFGYLIEGERGDYRLGEDVVTSVFPNGRLRDLRDPNNGTTRGRPGWQPAHMDEYQNLPLTEEGDRGGVHVNSGIPNRAFYLFSSDPSIGDARAEQVYYRALTTYLTRSSRFADLRIAVANAARDLYGDAAAAVAENAFAAVGIGGEGGDYTVDLETNEGDRFLLLANTAETSLFLAGEDGSLIENPLVQVGLASRPSLTDDGSAAVFVDDQGRLRVYNFVNRSLDFIEQEPGTNWRNAAISKDGRRLAVTTRNNDNEVLVFDFDTRAGRIFELTNPTTSTEGLSTGDVLFADALVWEPGGEFLMYDALSRLDDGLEFWDIGFLRAFDPDTGTFGDGAINKLIATLPDGVSIGNPTFSKNSPYIIAFEQVDFIDETFTIIGANIETGDAGLIFENSVINYPNYGMDDDRLVFDAQTTGGDNVLAVIPLAEDKISAGGQAGVLVAGGHWGYFFANGERNLNTGLESAPVEDNRIRVFPTVTADVVRLELGTARLTGRPSLFDQTGRELIRYGENTTSFSLRELPAGSYLLALPTALGTVVRRVVRR